MARAGDSHSRIVFWLKIILPLTALAILSTLFMVSRNIGGTGTIPFSEIDLDALAREQRLTAPEYAAVTDDGAALTVTGLSARPEGDATVATGITATYAKDAGLTVNLVAAEGRLDDASGTVAFGGGVTVETSTGYRLTTRYLTGRLDRTALTAPGAVTATAPYGRIDAGAMTLDRADATATDSILVFNRGVRLVYDPQH